MLKTRIDVEELVEALSLDSSDCFKGEGCGGKPEKYTYRGVSILA